MVHQPGGAKAVGGAYLNNNGDPAGSGIDGGLGHLAALFLGHQHAAAVGAVDKQAVYMGGEKVYQGFQALVVYFPVFLEGGQHGGHNAVHLKHSPSLLFLICILLDGLQGNGDGAADSQAVQLFFFVDAFHGDVVTEFLFQHIGI